MIKTSDILDENDKHLRDKNIDVTFPLKEETKINEEIIIIKLLGNETIENIILFFKEFVYLYFNNKWISLRYP